MPATSRDVVSVALPLLKVVVPSLPWPSKNSTESPLGGMPLAKLTDAVNVTGCPAFDGFRLEAIVVVVAAWFTV